MPTVLGSDIDECWDITVIAFAEPEGSLSVRSPAVDGCVGRHRAGVLVACRYLGYPESRWHLDADGGCTVVSGAVTELPVGVHPPAVSAAVIENRAGVEGARVYRNRRPPRGQRRGPWGKRVVVGAVTELPLSIVPPAIHQTVVEDATGVPKAHIECNQRAVLGEYRHIRGDVLAVVGPNTELPVGVQTPAHSATVVEDDAGRVHGSVDRYGGPSGGEFDVGWGMMTPSRKAIAHLSVVVPPPAVEGLVDRYGASVVDTGDNSECGLPSQCAWPVGAIAPPATGVMAVPDLAVEVLPPAVEGAV